MLLYSPKLSPGGGWSSHTNCGSRHSVGEDKGLFWLGPAKMAADRPFVEVAPRGVLLLDLPVAVSSAIWLGYRSLSCSWFKAKKYNTFSWNLTMCCFLLVSTSVSTTKKDMSSLSGGRDESSWSSMCAFILLWEAYTRPHIEHANLWVICVLWKEKSKTQTQNGSTPCQVYINKDK